MVPYSKIMVFKLCTAVYFGQYIPIQGTNHDLHENKSSVGISQIIVVITVMQHD